MELFNVSKTLQYTLFIEYWRNAATETRYFDGNTNYTNVSNKQKNKLQTV